MPWEPGQGHEPISFRPWSKLNLLRQGWFWVPGSGVQYLNSCDEVPDFKRLTMGIILVKTINGVCWWNWFSPFMKVTWLGKWLSKDCLFTSTICLALMVSNSFSNLAIPLQPVGFLWLLRPLFAPQAISSSSNSSAWHLRLASSTS
jgi:hypothetical protein